MASAPSSFVGSVPELYDRHLGPVFFTPYAADLAARVDPARLPLLEIASGTGRLTAPLLQRIGQAWLTALDLNVAMQRVARTRVPDRRARWVAGDAQLLPFPERRFAQAVCQFGVMFFPDKARAAAEVKRVLAPGGTFLFNVWDSLDVNPLAQIARDVTDQFFVVDPPTFFQVPFGYFDRDHIRRDLRDGGFGSIDIDIVDLLGPCESAAHIAMGLVQGSPLAGAIQERGTASPAAITDAVADALERQFGSESFEVPMRALVVRATA
jgi:SAM-dependent methyltransferase